MAEEISIIEDETPSGGSVTLFRTDDPVEVVARATATANALMDAVKSHDAGQKDKSKKLISVISGREFPKVECWTLLGTMLGVFPVCEWTRKIEGGWEARVVAQTLDGRTIGAAEAQCTKSEANWKNRDDYALRSMAQTRATSKALSVPLRFVMTLAGLEGTPAEEMPTHERTAPAAGETAKPDTLAELTITLIKLKDHEEWLIENVLRNATRKFGREITQLSDLTEDQAQTILKGAQLARESFVENDLVDKDGEDIEF